MYQCAKCPTIVCGAGDREHGPDFCPMLAEFPDTEELYADPLSMRIVRAATQVEGIGYRQWTRAEEIMEFAWRVDVARVGLDFCPSMSREAGIYAGILEANGFDVVMAGRDVKEGAQRDPVRRNLEKIDPARVQELCDPIAQANLCNQMATGLNVTVGLGVGHDSLFARHSDALVTCLIAKDAALGHNPVGAIYQADSYHRQGLYGAHREGKATRLQPELEECPMPGESYDDPDDQRIAVAADLIAFAGNPRWSRLEQTIEFARKVNPAKVGISACVGSSREAATVTQVLEANGFQVSSALRKTGAVPKETLGVLDSEKVRPGEPEMTCNPIVQAELLKWDETNLNITMGQCVGHDSLIMKHSGTWITYLVPKDRVLAHNPAAALYNAGGRFSRALYEGERPNAWKRR